MPQRSRKQSSIISDSEWRLVLPPSRQLGATLVWCFPWAGLQSVPPCKFHLILPQLRVPVQFHSASNERGSFRFQDPWCRNAWSVGSLWNPSSRAWWHSEARQIETLVFGAGKGLLIARVPPSWEGGRNRLISNPPCWLAGLQGF